MGVACILRGYDEVAFADLALYNDFDTSGLLGMSGKRYSIAGIPCDIDFPHATVLSVIKIGAAAQ